MSAQITLNWTKDSTFETLLDGHKVTGETSSVKGEREKIRVIG